MTKEFSLVYFICFQPYVLPNSYRTSHSNLKFSLVNFYLKINRLVKM
jgi:hypothetical protein